MPDIIYHRLLKKRYIYGIDRDSPDVGPVKNDHFAMEIIEDSRPGNHSDFLAAHFASEKLAARLRHPDILLFLVVERETGTPAAYSWALGSADTRFWHDCFPLPENTALNLDGYVLEPYRRRGIFHYISKYVQNYYLNEHGFDKICSVIESRNIPSIKSQIKAGCSCLQTNYLVKFNGINVFSMYENNGTWTIHYVLGNERRNNF